MRAINRYFPYVLRRVRKDSHPTGPLGPGPSPVRILEHLDEFNQHGALGRRIAILRRIVYGVTGHHFAKRRLVVDVTQQNAQQERQKLRTKAAQKDAKSLTNDANRRGASPVGHRRVRLPNRLKELRVLDQTGLVQLQRVVSSDATAKKKRQSGCRWRCWGRLAPELGVSSVLLAAK